MINLPTLLQKGYIPEKPEIIPIEYIYQNIMKNKILILKASTGSGKSTVLPDYLFGKVEKKIISAQPRVFNAIDIPRRIIQYNDKLVMGKNIGYQTGDFVKIPKTGILFITNGSFEQQIREMDDNAICDAYSVIILDEAHVLDLYSIRLHTFLKNFMIRNKTREDCPNLIITSATFDYNHFAEFYKTDNILKIKGLTYEIKSYFLTHNTQNFYTAIVETIHNIHTQNIDDFDNFPAITGKSRKFTERDVSDIIVFISGSRDIEIIHDEMIRLVKRNKSIYDKYPIYILNLSRTAVETGGENYDNLFLHASEIKTEYEQDISISISSDDIKKKKGTKNIFRKIILSTNVGETGITYPYVKYVIDSGFNKSREYLPDFGIHSFTNKPISKYSAKQRRGRVGRIAQGKFYGIYDEETFNSFKKIADNRLYKDDITLIISNMIENTESKIDIFNLDLIYAPSIYSIWRAVEKLYILGFMDTNMKFTDIGNLISGFKHLTIEQIKVLLAGYVWKVPMYDLIIVVATSVVLRQSKIKYKPTKFALESECDLIPMIEIFNNEDMFAELKPRDLQLFSIERDNIMDNLSCMGLNPYENMDDAYPNHKENYFKLLKQCLYEGYRLNTAVWNGKYYETPLGIDLYDKPYGKCHVNTFLFCDLELNITGNNLYNKYLGKSVLDGFVNVSRDFF